MFATKLNNSVCFLASVRMYHGQSIPGNINLGTLSETNNQIRVQIPDAPIDLAGL
jgi:hypothetical protein